MSADSKPLSERRKGSDPVLDVLAELHRLRARNRQLVQLIKKVRNHGGGARCTCKACDLLRAAIEENADGE